LTLASFVIVNNRIR